MACQHGLCSPLSSLKDPGWWRLHWKWLIDELGLREFRESSLTHQCLQTEVTTITSAHSSLSRTSHWVKGIEKWSYSPCEIVEGNWLSGNTVNISCKRYQEQYLELWLAQQHRWCCHSWLWENGGGTPVTLHCDCSSSTPISPGSTSSILSRPLMP